MSLNIDLKKHRKEAVLELEDAVNEINALYKRVECKNFKKIIKMAVEWFEDKKGLGYTFFNEALSAHTPTQFYESLYSFLVNTILDDSYYKVCWKKHKNGKWVDGKPWKDTPYVIWTNDMDPDRQHDAEKMWKAMEFLRDKDKKMQKLYKEIF